MTALSTAAWIGHDLGIATGVGGALFGQVALHPATRNMASSEERGMVVNQAWRTFSLYQLTGLGVMAASWFAGRTKLSGREVDGPSRTLTLVKDVCVLGALGTAIGTAVAGRKMAAQAPGGALPVSADGETLEPHAPRRAKDLHAIVNGLGIANMVCGVGVIATTAILAMRAGRSARWSVLSRFLP